MNERIEELAGQCIDPKWTVTGPIFDREKFAQLIAQECMGLCEETQAEYLKHRRATSDTDEKIIYAEGEAACDVVRYKIKRHFGVEE
jgi:hypothetical protein